jgi:hypothetical protein
LANVEPGAGPAVRFTVTDPQLSLAAGIVHVAVGVHAERVIFAGHVMTGAMLSFTVMICEVLELLLQISVAVQVRVIV